MQQQVELERYCELVAALRLRTTNKNGRHLSQKRAIELLEDYISKWRRKSLDRSVQTLLHTRRIAMNEPFSSETDNKRATEDGTFLDGELKARRESDTGWRRVNETRSSRAYFGDPDSHTHHMCGAHTVGWPERSMSSTSIVRTMLYVALVLLVVAGFSIDLTHKLFEVGLLIGGSAVGALAAFILFWGARNSKGRSALSIALYLASALMIVEVAVVFLHYLEVQQ